MIYLDIVNQKSKQTTHRPKLASASTGHIIGSRSICQNAACLQINNSLPVSKGDNQHFPPFLNQPSCTFLSIIYFLYLIFCCCVNHIMYSRVEISKIHSCYLKCLERKHGWKMTMYWTFQTALVQCSSILSETSGNYWITEWRHRYSCDYDATNFFWGTHFIHQ